MFNTSYSLEQLNAMGQNNMLNHLGIEFVELTADYLVAKMPVDHRTKQPMGLLHGGASVVLARVLYMANVLLSKSDVIFRYGKPKLPTKLAT